MTSEKLAIEGGAPVRTAAMPKRALITEEEKAAAIAVFDEAIESGDAFGYGGKYEKQYEEKFAAFMGGGYANGVNSGTNAIFTALGALNLDAMSEVIVPPLTDAGGVMPVVFLGCIPVMADSSTGSFNTDAGQIERVLTERTRAVIVAHIAGEPVDMAPVMELARKHDLFVVEDCSQAHGATYRNEKVGNFGDVAAFSTMFSKQHCTGGQGGVVFSKNEKLIWRNKRFSDRGKPFGIKGEKNNVVAGLNCNSNELAAAIGCVQLERLPEIVEKRQKFASELDRHLTDCKTVRLAPLVPDATSAYWIMRFKLDTDRLRVDKEQFCSALLAEGIPANHFFRYIPCDMPWFKNKAVFGKSGFPWNCSDYKGDKNPEIRLDNIDRATKEHFYMPINERYSGQELEDILAAIKKVETHYFQRV